MYSDFLKTFKSFKMKKYLKLFIPFYGIYYSRYIDMCELAYTHSIIWWGSAIVQGICLVTLFWFPLILTIL